MFKNMRKLLQKNQLENSARQADITKYLGFWTTYLQFDTYMISQVNRKTIVLCGMLKWVFAPITFIIVLFHRLYLQQNKFAFALSLSYNLICVCTVPAHMKLYDFNDSYTYR